MIDVDGCCFFTVSENNKICPALTRGMTVTSIPHTIPNKSSRSIIVLDAERGSQSRRRKTIFAATILQETDNW